MSDFRIHTIIGLVTILVASLLIVTMARACEEAAVPKKYHGDWCLIKSPKNKVERAWQEISSHVYRRCTPAMLNNASEGDATTVQKNQIVGSESICTVTKVAAAAGGHDVWFTCRYVINSPVNRGEDWEGADHMLLSNGRLIISSELKNSQ